MDLEAKLDDFENASSSINYNSQQKFIKGSQKPEQLSQRLNQKLEEQNVSLEWDMGGPPNPTTADLATHPWTNSNEDSQLKIIETDDLKGKSSAVKYQRIAKQKQTFQSTDI